METVAGASRLELVEPTALLNLLFLDELDTVLDLFERFDLFSETVPLVLELLRDSTVFVALDLVTCERLLASDLAATARRLFDLVRLKVTSLLVAALRLLALRLTSRLPFKTAALSDLDLLL